MPDNRIPIPPRPAPPLVSPPRVKEEQVGKHTTDINLNLQIGLSPELVSLINSYLSNLQEYKKPTQEVGSKRENVETHHEEHSSNGDFFNIDVSGLFMLADGLKNLYTSNSFDERKFVRRGGSRPEVVFEFLSILFRGKAGNIKIMTRNEINAVPNAYELTWTIYHNLNNRVPAIPPPYALSNILEIIFSDKGKHSRDWLFFFRSHLDDNNRIQYLIETIEILFLTKTLRKLDRQQDQSNENYIYELITN